MTTDIKLNPFIFRQLIPLLFYKSNFNEILKFSLLSKSIFKVIQGLLTNCNDKYFFEINLPFPSLDKYLKNNCSSDGDENYNKKLIQFKAINHISVIDNSINIDTNTEKQFQFYRDNFKNLKSVYFKNDIISPPKYPNNDTQSNNDSLCFFIYEKVWLYYDSTEPPCSNLEELIEFKNFQHGNRWSFNFSFNYLSNYPCKKLYITTINEFYLNLNLKSLSNLISTKYFKFIETIKFIKHDTPISFINQVLSNDCSNGSNLKSFSIRYNRDGENVDHSDIMDNNTTIVISDNQKSITDNRLLNDLTQPLSNTIASKKLKRLIIKSFKNSLIRGSNPKKLLQLILHQKLFHLKTIGLEIFKIENDSHLSPLNELNEISTIQCLSDSIEAVFEHSIQNKNIKKLKIVFPSMTDVTNNQLLIFSNFFKQQHQYLESLVIVKDHFFNEQPLKSLFNNNNNNLKLIFKTDYHI